MSYKILHFADLHLEASFAHLRLPSHVGAARRNDLRATLGRIMALAREHHVDAITIAGDLYDHEYALPDTASLLVEQFGRIAPVRVIISPGKADPCVTGSLYQFTEWPSNVTIFTKGALSPVELTPQILLWGAACPPSRGYETVQPIRGGGSETSAQPFNILLIHTLDAEENPAQTASQDLFTLNIATLHYLGFDFALLGHEHSGRSWPHERPSCVYPGSPEPFSAGEVEGNHGVTLVTVNEGTGAFDVDHIPLSQWRYAVAKADLTGCDNFAEAATRVRLALSMCDTTDPERLAAHIELVGRPLFDLDCTRLLDEVNLPPQVGLVDNTAPAYDIDRLLSEPTVRGLLAQQLNSRLNTARDLAEAQTVHDTLRFSMAALEGKPIFVPRNAGYTQEGVEG
ncbi:MAG: metallophosphoesterase [Chloroflexota bacterium]